MLDFYASFVNLDSRPDRLTHMETQLSRIDLKAVRTPGIMPENLDVPRETIAAMLNRTPGAAGCHFAQISIMQAALSEDKNALIMEDDIIFCFDFWERMEIASEFLENNEWDVFWLGSSFHINPPFWHPIGRSGMPPDCSSNLGKDAKLTQNPRMIQTFGAFATFAYIVNVRSIEKILTLFEKHLHESIGIDWLFIKLQPQLKCFSFLPGLVMQGDWRSDIGKGMTIWSNFLRLGPYVYQERMNDFDPTKFDWKECRA